jgi:hypothetical protein
MQLKNSILKLPLYWLAIFYLIWLLFILVFFGYTPSNDGMGYLEYAQLCLQEKQPYPTTTIYQTTPFIWNIGIINLTELSLWLTHSIKPLLIVLCIMKAATALFIGLITQRLFSLRVAVVTMLLFIIYPNNWGQSTMISSEIPSTCLAVIATWIILTALDQQNIKNIISKFLIAGFILGLANWFRPTATIFIIAIITCLALFQRCYFLQRVFAFLAGYFIFIAVVGTSCWLRTGHFVYQSRSYWFSMVDECYDGAEVAPHWGQPIWPEGYPRYIENHEQMDCFAFDSIWRERSLEWLKDNKLQYISKLPGRLYYMYQADIDYMSTFIQDKSHSENNYIILPYRHLLSEWHTLDRAQWFSLISMIYYAILLIMFIIGAVLLLRKRPFNMTMMPLFIVTIGTLMLIIVMHGETRFKDPLMPFLFILAAIPFNKILKR